MIAQEALDRFMNPSTRPALMRELADQVDEVLAAGAAGRRRDCDHAERVVELVEIMATLSRAVEVPDLQGAPS